MISTPLPSGLSPIAIAVGDFNRDGKTDLAATASNGTNTILIIFLANGDSTLTMGAEYPLGSFSYYTNVIAADFNQDGNLDLAAVNPSTAQLFVLLGNGDGTFRNPVSTTIQLLTGYLAAADFDADGKLDLALTEINGIFTLLGNGDGTFQAPINAAGNNILTEIDLLAPGDFNSDGKTDLAVAGTGGEYPSVLLRAGDGTFQTVNLLAAFPDVGGLGAADFNSDGTLDLAFSTTSGFPSPALIGMISSPFVSLFPPSVKFGAQEVGVTSEPESVVVANIGNAPLSVTIVSANGDFSQTNACEGTVAVGANCSISVTFTPTAPGSRTGTIMITDNASGSPQVITLTGTGLGPAIGLSPTSLTFGNQFVGTTSVAETVTLANSGNEPLTLSHIATSGDFAETNVCGNSLNAGTCCSIAVTFTPTGSGSRTGTLTLTDNAYGTTQTLSLTGTGIAPMVSVSSASLTFASQLLSTSSTSQSVTLTNTGTGTLTITSIAISGANAGDFAKTNACGSSLTAGASCTLSVTFTPSGISTRSATVWRGWGKILRWPP